MAKFYVQSGTVRSIIDSEDAERAALWVVHRAMDSTLPLDETSVLDEELEETVSGEFQESVYQHASQVEFSQPLNRCQSPVITRWGSQSDSSGETVLDWDRTNPQNDDQDSYLSSSHCGGLATARRLALGSKKKKTTYTLAETIQVSELGFDRDDARVFDTLESFRHWYELFQAVQILADRFGV